MIVMKAISMWQPWGSLWLTDRKMHETRHWATAHRGWLIVHAAKKFEKNFEQGDPLRTILDDEFGGHWAMDLPTGAIIGAVDITNCMRMDRTAPAHPDDMECGNWEPERFAWRKARSVTLKTPIPYRGRQGMFNVPADDIAQLLEMIPPEQTC